MGIQIKNTKLNLSNVKSYNTSDSKNINYKLENNMYTSTVDESSAYSTTIEDIDEKTFTNNDLYINNANYQNIQSDGFTVQGYTIADTETHLTANSKVLISAYTKGENSRIYIYDSVTGEYEGMIILDNQEHVGGATFDSENQILYVTSSSGTVSSYDYVKLTELIELAQNITTDEYIVDLSTETQDDSFKIENNINIYELLNSSDRFIYGNQSGMDSIFYHNGYLYSVTYSQNGELVKTEIDIQRDPTTNEITGIYEKKSTIEGELNGAVQGLAFFEDSGVEYLVTSSSALLSKSRLTLWEIQNDGSLQEIGKKTIEQSGLEGIYINNGVITGIFEYGNQELQELTTISELKESEGNFINDIGLSLKGGWWDSANS